MCQVDIAALLTFLSIFCAGNSIISVCPLEEQGKIRKMQVSSYHILLEGTILPKNRSREYDYNMLFAGWTCYLEVGLLFFDSFCFDRHSWTHCMMSRISAPTSEIWNIIRTTSRIIILLY